MNFDKTIQKPHVTKEKKEKIYSPINYGLDINLEKLKKDIQDIQHFTEINFLMHNLEVKDMLSSKNIHMFKNITKKYKNTKIIIEKTRNTWRKITVNGEDAYLVYQELKKI